MTKAKQTPQELPDISLLDVVRWIALLPAICLTWWATPLLCARFLYTHWWDSRFQLWIILSFFVMPSITMFFVAKLIAPKYKNIIGCIAVVLCVSFGSFLLYELH